MGNAPQVGYPPQGVHPPQAGHPWPVAGRSYAEAHLGRGLFAAAGVAGLAAFVYAAILRFTDHEIGYAALAVGLVVGAAAGKAGGRARSLPVLAAVISLLAVWLGQLVGIAWTIAHHVPGLSFGQVFFDHFGDLVKAWKDDFIDAKDILFLAIAGVEGFFVTRRVTQP